MNRYTVFKDQKGQSFKLCKDFKEKCANLTFCIKTLRLNIALMRKKGSVTIFKAKCRHSKYLRGKLLLCNIKLCTFMDKCLFRKYAI